MPVKLDLDGDFHEMNPTDSGSQARLSRKSSSLSTTHDSPRYGATHTFFRLTPAGAKRTKDESSVSLFLLHRGERVAPLRLYVRTFGESNDRVMVRVGGGWADLGEWLREYIAHHGQRAVLENWEVKTVPESRPPSRQSPRKRTGSMLGPRSGRSTPASMRPESRTEPFPDFQPAVPPIPPEWRDSVPRKRGQTAQRPSLTAANIAKASGSPAPRSPILASLSRRMSVSSMASGSMSVFSAFAENIHGPSANPFFTHPAVRPDTSLGFRKPSSPFSAAASVTGASPSILSHTPLGLAGPRARRVTITAESEAWVQDMMGKTRRPSGPRSQILASIPFPLEEAFENDGSQSQQRQHEPLQSQQQPLQTQSGPGMQMMRSFNDIDRFNKRVFLQRFKQ
ncbi:hypothetical protein KEM52_006388 [Ascosphaera acerosa]|nr:hypothetical protein KEM52_006388 [Ascosphaera acerosa]